MFLILMMTKTAKPRTPFLLPHLIPPHHRLPHHLSPHHLPPHHIPSSSLAPPRHASPRLAPPCLAPPRLAPPRLAPSRLAPLRFDCSISSPAIGDLPQVAPLTGQSPPTVEINLWHSLWGVTAASCIFNGVFSCLSYLSACTHYDCLS